MQMLIYFLKQKHFLIHWPMVTKTQNQKRMPTYFLMLKQKQTLILIQMHYQMQKH
jgi:hypothetical protein